jgi:hypothetical protein
LEVLLKFVKAFKFRLNQKIMDSEVKAYIRCMHLKHNLLHNVARRTVAMQCLQEGTRVAW